MSYAPRGLRTAGRRLWRAIDGAFDLEEHEHLLLMQACRTADACDDLQAEVDRDGVSVEVAGQLRAHPSLVELRQQRVVMARLVAALRVPMPDQGEARTQHRGIRGVYQLPGGHAS